jgi:hypothetical protein
MPATTIGGAGAAGVAAGRDDTKRAEAVWSSTRAVRGLWMTSAVSLSAP